MKKNRTALRAAAVFTLALASLTAALSFSTTALAEDRQGASGWQVAFDGRQMESNFTTANIGDEVNAMQPGDSVELTITLKNDFDGQADWYMKNEVLSSLEDSGDAAGGAYDYLLTYTDHSGETTTLYSSEKFGGDGRINGVGLHGADSTLEDYFYLDRMGKGASGVIKLKVALDGETLVNNYQNTFARLQMDFATEMVGGSGLRQGPVKTGDESRILLYVILLFASGLGLLAGGLVMLSRNQKEEEKVEAVQAGRRRGEK